MEPFAPPHQPDPALQFQRDAYHELSHTLRSMLPPPIEDTEEGRARRDRVALGKVAAMAPANPVEADLAAYHVAAMAHVAHCVREAEQSGGDRKRVAQLEAQAIRMGREARGYISKFVLLQTARRKREATQAGCDSAAITEHCVFGLMTDALDSIAPAPAEAMAPQPAPVRRSGLPAPPVPSPPPRTAPAPEETAEPQPDLAAEAERYAIVYPHRARLIRSHGGVPDDCDFGPPEPELVPFIVTGTSPALLAVDGKAAVAT